MKKYNAVIKGMVRITVSVVLPRFLTYLRWSSNVVNFSLETWRLT